MVGIRQLAQYLDISIGTVSRALNGRPDVNKETRRRVLEAAATLGYTPNQSGRSLRKGATGVVAVIIPTVEDRPLGDTIFMTVMDGLRAELVKKNLDLVILLCGAEQDPFEFVRRTVERGMSDGIIISNTERVDPRVDYLVEKNIPFVTFGRSTSNKDRAWVDLDFEGAAQQAVRRLAASGHKRIALANIKTNHNYGFVFETAYRAAVMEAGLEIDDSLIIKTRGAEAGGYEMGCRLMELDDPADAVVLIESAMATGLYKRLSEAGIRPGVDVSIIGFLEWMNSRFVEPSLTCFNMDLRAVGAALGRALVPLLPSHPDYVPGKYLQEIRRITFVEGDSVSVKNQPKSPQL